MKRILFLDREDLVDDRKLTTVSNIEMIDFHGEFHDALMNAEIVIFHCELTKSYKVVKNRCGTITPAISLDGMEDRERFVSYILEAIR